MGSYNFTSITGDGEEGGEILLSGLSKFTRYTIVIQAYNEVGSGPLSEPVTAQTMEDGIPITVSKLSKFMTFFFCIFSTK